MRFVKALSLPREEVLERESERDLERESVRWNETGGLREKRMIYIIILAGKKCVVQNILNILGFLFKKKIQS